MRWPHGFFSCYWLFVVFFLLPLFVPCTVPSDLLPTSGLCPCFQHATSLASQPMRTYYSCPILAKGELQGSLAGRYASVLRLASSLSVDQPPPTVMLETQQHSFILRDYDTLTVVMKCKREEMED